MAYIPTIHTFEDDINENRGVEEPPIIGGVEGITKDNSILVPEKGPSSLGKKLLTLFSIIFILASLSLIGYYFYNKNQIKLQEEAALQEAIAKNAEQAVNENFTNDLVQIFNRSGEDMAISLKDAVKRNNIIILTIDNREGKDGYSSLYTYVLAHIKDIGSDLFDTFGLEEILESSLIEETEEEINTSTSTKVSTSSASNSTSTEKTKSNVLDKIINPKDITNDFGNMLDKFSRPSPISGRDLIWESKTINNQDLEIANAGVVSLIYGYVGKDYLVFTTSLKDFFDTANSLR